MVRSNELALERDSELMLISKILNFSSEDGHEYKFLLVVDTGNKLATAIKKSERTSEKSLELLKTTYMIDINEYPNAIDEVIKRSLTLKDLTQLFPKLVTVYEFVNNRALSYGWRFGFQNQKFVTSEINLELAERINKELTLRKSYLNRFISNREIEELVFLQDLEEGLIGGAYSDRVDQLGFYPIEPITFEEEIPFYWPKFILFGQRNRRLKAYGYPLIENEITNTYLGFVNEVLSFYDDAVGSQSSTSELNKM
ncbi:MAG: hypothetical protein U0M29_04100 [Streptococcus salivarius]|uniref:hypothetical protein n=1 Tax=Streptococcus salivarius TaxID=1304 RepID=UPI00290B9BEE|nr:hypothetical protein [Streptococcus salivarius]